MRNRGDPGKRLLSCPHHTRDDISPRLPPHPPVSSSIRVRASLEWSPQSAGDVCRAWGGLEVTRISAEQTSVVQMEFLGHREGLLA